jgi:tetratricopeptide (TPR) repeat protein
MARLKKLLKGAAWLAGASIMIAGIAYLARVAYRQTQVQMALSEARQFTLPKNPAPTQSPSSALALLKPHPWSSPMHNRKFDEAIAGARAAYDRGDYDQAIALNTEALEIHPSQDLVWLLLTRRGDCYLEKNELDKALAEYNAAERLEKLDAHGYSNRAYVWWRKGEHDQATKEFEAAIAEHPDDPLIYISRAQLLGEAGKLDLAVADYAKALELSPKNIATRLALANLYLRRNDTEKALREASIVLQINPNYAGAYVTRAKAYAHWRMNSRALAELDAATKLKDRDPIRAFNTVAWCHATCGQDALRDGKRAVMEASKACELDHWKEASYIDTLAAACAEAGDFDHAVQYQKQVLHMIPGQGQALDKAKARLELYEHHKPYREEIKP